MINRTKFAFLLCLTLLYSSCYEDIDLSTKTEIPHQPETNVDCEALIKLIDASGNIINDYTLNANDNILSVNTDFYFGPLEKVSDKNQVVLFKKDGQIISVTNASFFLNEISYIESELFPTYTTATENTDNIIQLTDSNIGEFDFNSTLFEDDQGSDYIGEVQISTLGLSTQNLLHQMCHVATNLQGQKVRVHPSSAFNITLQKMNNETLQISNPIDLKLNQISDNQSLFFLDEDQSRWVQIEQEISDIVVLEKVGFYLIGSTESARFTKGNITFQNKKINKANLAIVNQDQEIVYTSKTTNSGNWAAYLVESEEEKLSVKDDCLSEIKSFELNLDSNLNLNIEEIQRTLGDIELIDCQGDRIENGVIISIKNENTINHFYPNTESIILSCHSDFEITAIDSENSSELSSMQWDNTINKDIKLFHACENLGDKMGYLKIKENRKVYELTLEQSSIDQTILNSLDGKFQLKFSGNQMKDYNDQEVNILLDDSSFGNDGYKINCFSTMEGCGVNLFEVTSYDLNGEIRIYFEGEIWMQTIEPPTAGYFDVQGMVFIKQ